MEKIAVRYIGDNRDAIRQQPKLSREEFIEILGWDDPTIDFEYSDWVFEGSRKDWIQKESIEDPNNTVYSDALLGCSNIEFNVTDLCNRSCWMCPHTNPEIFPNKNDMMTLETLKNVVDSLVPHNYVNGITFGSWGEPLLNPHVIDMISYVSEKLPECLIMIYSNADRLMKGSIPGYGEFNLDHLRDSGVSEFHVDIYDNDQRCAEVLKVLQPMIGIVNLVVHRRYAKVESDVFVSRAGTMDPQTGQKPTDEKRRSNKSMATHIRYCYAPINGAFIDWNGDMRACCHEWSRELPTGGNVNETPFSELWRSSENMNQLRKTLFNSREMISPCDQCEAAGGYRSESGLRAAKLWRPILEEMQDA